MSCDVVCPYLIPTSTLSLDPIPVQVRDFHCRLSSRGLRDDFETGIDIEAMMNMEKITGEGVGGVD